jgi:hypothetical protein
MMRTRMPGYAGRSSRSFSRPGSTAKTLGLKVPLTLQVAADEGSGAPSIENRSVRCGVA